VEIAIRCQVRAIFVIGRRATARRLAVRLDPARGG